MLWSFSVKIPWWSKYKVIPNMPEYHLSDLVRLTCLPVPDINLKKKKKRMVLKLFVFVVSNLRVLKSLWFKYQVSKRTQNYVLFCLFLISPSLWNIYTRFSMVFWFSHILLVTFLYSCPIFIKILRTIMSLNHSFLIKKRVMYDKSWLRDNIWYILLCIK